MKLTFVWIDSNASGAVGETNTGQREFGRTASNSGRGSKTRAASTSPRTPTRGSAIRGGRNNARTGTPDGASAFQMAISAAASDTPAAAAAAAAAAATATAPTGGNVFGQVNDNSTRPARRGPTRVRFNDAVDDSAIEVRGARITRASAAAASDKYNAAADASNCSLFVKFAPDASVCNDESVLRAHFAQLGDDVIRYAIGVSRVCLHLAYRAFVCVGSA
jgi:hypothetical protein